MKLVLLILLGLVTSCLTEHKAKDSLDSEPDHASAVDSMTQTRTPESAPARRVDSAQSSDSEPAQADLGRERALLDDSNAALRASDYATARSKAAEAVGCLLARLEGDQNASWLALLNDLGRAARDAQDATSAKRAWERVLEVRSRELADDHPDIQRVREDLADANYALGDLASARSLQEKVLEVRARTLPEDHSDLQTARLNLARTIKALGDLTRARELFETVIEVRSRTLPDDHPDLQAARLNLSATMYSLGDLTGARALQEKVLEVYSRTLSEDHPDLRKARNNLGMTLHALGELQAARALKERVLEVCSRTLPDDHLDLQAARLNLAVTKFSLGDFEGARGLFEKALGVYSRTLPEAHPFVQAARGNLAATMFSLGDLGGARVLQEKVLEAFMRTLPEKHPELQAARNNLAATMFSLGDLRGARTLFEKGLDICSRSLPDYHLDLQTARQNMAATIKELGDLEGARALLEKALEVGTSSLADDDPALQMMRLNLAATKHALGDLASARVLFEKVLEVRSLNLPNDHPDLQTARQLLAITAKGMGDLARARALEEGVLEILSRTLPPDHPSLQTARQNLAVTIALLVSQDTRLHDGQNDPRTARVDEAGRKRFSDLTLAIARSLRHSALTAIAGSSSREAEERVSSRSDALGLALSLAMGLGVFRGDEEWQHEVFLASESMRCAALSSARIARAARLAPNYDELRSRVRTASGQLAHLALSGGSADDFSRARGVLECAERDLVLKAVELAGGEVSLLEPSMSALAGKLSEAKALVAYRSYRRTTIAHDNKPHESTVQSLCAYVVRSDVGEAQAPKDPTPSTEDDRSDRATKSTMARGGMRLERVELGAIEPIERAVREWREALGLAAGRGVSVTSHAPQSSLQTRGDALRRLVFDPLKVALGQCDHVVLTLDDVLHLVPFDALPADEGGLEFLGDQIRFETHSTLLEILEPPVSTHSSPVLLTLGGVTYDQVAMSSDSELSYEDSIPVRAGTASIVRGDSGSASFAPLPGTLEEVEGVEELFRLTSESVAKVQQLHGSAGTRNKLFELAPSARFVHLATHGWFASELTQSWHDPSPLDEKSGLGSRLSSDEQVRGMNPMLLCGLALAGANLLENALGCVPGLITAEELAALDLTNCQLAVLSACDTNVGERRAGQGVASMQRALQMAGARSVITSLWKVSDDSTRELMINFYRRMWVEGKPKWQALWEAKKHLREAKVAGGQPKYFTRDWGAWVLTGDPN